MSLSKFLGMSFLIGFVIVAASHSSFADRITNGDFEAEPALVSWTTWGSAAELFDLGSENDCARLLKGAGVLGQSFALVGDETGLSNFQIDFDVAVLDTGSSRGFSMQFCKLGGTMVDSFRVEGVDNLFGVHSGSWEDSDLAIATTEDVGGDGIFSSSEDPVFNHITLIATNYGGASGDRTLTLVVDGDDENAYTRTSSDTRFEITSVTFNSQLCSTKDFLVDNVAVTVTEVPEPSTMMLLGSILGCVWLLRRNHKKKA